MNLQELALPVAKLLKDRKETVAVAESSAGGLISAALLAVPGASAYYLGGAIIYTRPGRSALLDLKKEDMAGIRSASEPFALLLAKRARESLGATWGLAETGAAGPSGNRYGDPAGHACFAVAGPAEMAVTYKTWSADREANMWAFPRRALMLLESCLTEGKKK